MFYLYGCTCNTCYPLSRFSLSPSSSHTLAVLQHPEIGVSGYFLEYMLVAQQVLHCIRYLLEINAQMVCIRVSMWVYTCRCT